MARGPPGIDGVLGRLIGRGPSGMGLEIGGNLDDVGLVMDWSAFREVDLRLMELKKLGAFVLPFGESSCCLG